MSRRRRILNAYLRFWREDPADGDWAVIYANLKASCVLLVVLYVVRLAKLA